MQKYHLDSRYSLAKKYKYDCLSLRISLTSKIVTRSKKFAIIVYNYVGYLSHPDRLWSEKSEGKGGGVEIEEKMHVFLL